MDKHEIIDLFLTLSDRVKLQINEKYQSEFPRQCRYVLVDNVKTKFYKCNLCLESKSLIACGPRNAKDCIRKHHDINHQKLFNATAANRQSDGAEPVNQKKLKTSLSKFQLSHMDKSARDTFGKKLLYGRRQMIYHITLSMKNLVIY